MSNEGAARLISELCDRADTREEELCTELAKAKERIAELEAQIKRGQRRVDLLSGKRITEERGDEENDA